MNVTQQLKLLGLMRETKLRDTKTAPIPQALQEEAQLVSNGAYCGNPIHRDDEIADSDPDTVNESLELGDRELAEHVIGLHQQASPDDAEEAGSGSWRAGCAHMSEWYGPEDHSMNYYVERSTFSSNWKRPVTDEEYQHIVDWIVYDEEYGGPWGPLKTVADCKRVFVYTEEEAAQDAGAQVGDLMDMLDLCFFLTEEVNRRVGCGCKRVYTGPDGQHNGHVRGKNMPGSLAGYAYFNDATCNDHVNMYLDNLLGQNFRSSFTLTAHEFGHWLNLQHQFNGQSGNNGHHEMMSYSSTFWTAQGYSTGESPFKLPRAPSLRPLQRFFDYENHIPPPLTGEVTPTPPDEPKTLPGEFYGEVVNGKVVIRGEMTMKKEFSLDTDTRFIFVPHPEEVDKFILREAVE